MGRAQGLEGGRVRRVQGTPTYQLGGALITEDLDLTLLMGERGREVLLRAGKVTRLNDKPARGFWLEGRTGC